MADITLRQRRYSSVRDGVPLYHLEIVVERAMVTDRQDPIDPNVFVFSIGSVGALDTFARVATVADLDILLSSRVDAIALSNTEFRTNTVVLTFQDLDTAIAAIPVIRDRVNALTTVRNKAIDEFITNRQVFEIPSPVELSSVKQELVDAYTGARDARTAADSAQAAAQNTYDEAQAASEKQQDVAEARCEQSDALDRSHALAVRSGEALASAKGSLMAALRAAARLTRTLGSSELKPSTDFVNSDGEFKVSGNADQSPPDFYGAGDVSEVYTEDPANDRVTFIVQGNIVDVAYVKVGTVLSVAKKTGGAYVGTIVAQPVAIDSADGAGDSGRTRITCAPIRPGISAEDFFQVGFKMTQRNMTQEVSGGQEVDPDTGQITQLPAVLQAVTVMEQTPTVEFSSVRFLDLQDSIGVSGDGGLSEQAINPVMSLIDPLLNPSTGILAVVSEEKTIANAKCQSANLVLNSLAGEESTALSDLNEKKAEAVSAQAKEDAALSNLKEYCPDLDVTTI